MYKSSVNPIYLTIFVSVILSSMSMDANVGKEEIISYWKPAFASFFFVFYSLNYFY